MSQVNVNPGGDRVIERDRSGEGFSMGMILAIVLGVALLALVAWYAVFQSGWFGAGAGYSDGGSTNVNVTTNQPANPSGLTGSTGGSATGSTSGSTGATTSGSTSGGTTNGGR
jgi:hypothetical protein